MVRIVLSLAVTLFAGIAIAEEAELNLSISEKNYQRLISAVAEDRTNFLVREDYYFEIFHDQKYILRNHSPALKVRLMDKGTGVKFQIQRKLSSEENGLFKLNTTDSVSTKINRDSAFLSTLKDFDRQLLALQPQTKETQQKIRQHFHSSGLLIQIKNECSGCKEELLVLSHFNKKERMEISIPFRQKSLQLVIGKTVNRDQIDYEIEAELKSKADAASAGVVIADWLKTKAFDFSDRPSPKTDPAALSLSRLNQLYTP